VTPGLPCPGQPVSMSCHPSARESLQSRARLPRYSSNRHGPDNYRDRWSDGCHPRPQARDGSTAFSTFATSRQPDRKRGSLRSCRRSQCHAHSQNQLFHRSTKGLLTCKRGYEHRVLLTGETRGWTSDRCFQYCSAMKSGEQIYCLSLWSPPGLTSKVDGRPGDSALLEYLRMQRAGVYPFSIGWAIGKINQDARGVASWFNEKRHSSHGPHSGELREWADGGAQSDSIYQRTER